MENAVYLLLGSNLGNRENNLSHARKSIQKFGPLEKASAIYQTQAWGNTQQPDFLNQVIQISCTQTPSELLQHIQGIENEMGRKRMEKWGPRTIDIDILFFGHCIVDEPELIIPHPAIASRRFTLLPLSEIAGKLIHPLLHKSCDQLLEECLDASKVVCYTP